jgi:hypothetical protein
MGMTSSPFGRCQTGKAQAARNEIIAAMSPLMVDHGNDKDVIVIAEPDKAFLPRLQNPPFSPFVPEQKLWEKGPNPGSRL